MRRMARIVTCLALLVPMPARAVPAVLAGALASDNVDYVATLPDVPAIGGKILGTTMYVTTLQGIRTYDISVGVPVLMGALELPHWENESVDTNGTILLVAADHFLGVLNTVYVVDVSDPHVPKLLSQISLSHSAHTATCIADCTYAWTAGGDVIDLRDPTTPKLAGMFSYGFHHADVDAAGIAWVGGSTGYDLAGYASGDILRPTPYARVSKDGFGWHGTLRPHAEKARPDLLANGAIDPGELLIGTDENWAAASNGFCQNDGPFITSWLHTSGGQLRVDRLDSFTIGQGSVPDARPGGVVACSSHWFDEHGGVVADGWYEQGLRFLDVSSPRAIRQIGYFMPADTEVWGALYHEAPDAPLPGLYVYTFDLSRGIDVLRFTGKAGDPPALAPLNEAPASIVAHPTFGFVCRLES